MLIYRIALQEWRGISIQGRLRVSSQTSIRPLGAILGWLERRQFLPFLGSIKFSLAKGTTAQAREMEGKANRENRESLCATAYSRNR